MVKCTLVFFGPDSWKCREDIVESQKLMKAISIQHDQQTFSIIKPRS